MFAWKVEGDRGLLKNSTTIKAVAGRRLPADSRRSTARRNGPTQISAFSCWLARRDTHLVAHPGKYCHHVRFWDQTVVRALLCYDYEGWMCWCIFRHLSYVVEWRLQWQAVFVIYHRAGACVPLYRASVPLCIPPHRFGSDSDSTTLLSLIFKSSKFTTSTGKKTKTSYHVSYHGVYCWIRTYASAYTCRFVAILSITYF